MNWISFCEAFLRHFLWILAFFGGFNGFWVPLISNFYLYLKVWTQHGYCASNEWANFLRILRSTVLEIWYWSLLGGFRRFSVVLQKTRLDQQLSDRIRNLDPQKSSSHFTSDFRVLSDRLLLFFLSLLIFWLPCHDFDMAAAKLLFYYGLHQAIASRLPPGKNCCGQAMFFLWLSSGHNS